MSKYRTMLIVVIAWLLTGCFSESLVEPTTTPVAMESQPPIVVHPGITISPSPIVTTSIISRPTITPTTTPTSIPELLVEYQNITVESSIPPDLDLEGVLVMGGASNRDGDFLLNLQNGEKVMLPDQEDGLRFTSISPNRQLLAYFDVVNGDRRLQIAVSNGQPIFSYPCDKNWYYIVQWLDNEKLIIDIDPYFEDTVVIFNVYNGKWQEIVPTFSLDSLDSRLHGFDGYIFPEPDPIYDPTLSRVVFQRYSTSENHYTLELWDSQMKQPLWTQSNVIVQSRPVWSPNGEFFNVVFALSSELYAEMPSDKNAFSLYIISRNGQETKLTNKIARGGTWSPNGRYIAVGWQMPLEIDGFVVEGAIALAIMDLITKDIDVFPLWSASGYHIWSPDGRFLAFDNILSIYDDPFDIETRVVVIDTVNNRAYEVTKNAKVVGWMISSDD